MSLGTPAPVPWSDAQVRQVVAAAPPALISDLDGTLTEIAPTPEEVQVSPQIRRLLDRLAQRLPLVAILSGRPAAQVHELVGLDGLVYGGNHGLDWWCHGRLHLDSQAEPYRQRVQVVAAMLTSRLAPLGVLIEDKGVALGLHYRLSPDPEAARAAILKAIEETAAAEPFQVQEGKRVVELRPAIPVNKGTALRALLEKYRPQAAIYLGDDLTDRDALAALKEWGSGERRPTLAVVVESEETPSALVARADVRLVGVEGVAEFLAWLAASLPS